MEKVGLSWIAIVHLIACVLFKSTHVTRMGNIVSWIINEN